MSLLQKVKNAYDPYDVLHALLSIPEPRPSYLGATVKRKMLS